jgi:DNA-binding MltR family transcriptional regulator
MGKNRELAHGDGLSALNSLTGRLSDLDEQALVLAASAFAEDTLTKLLKAFMLPNRATDSLLEGFSAPIGTLSAKTKACYALGLVTKAQFDDLENLRTIRNAFSHTWEVVAFSDPSIRDRIKNMSHGSLTDEFPEGPLAKVRNCVSSLLVELEVTASQITKKGTAATLIGSGLIAGQTGTIDEQLREAKHQIDKLNDDIVASSGEKADFLKMLEQRWVSRLTIAAANAPADRRLEVLTLQRELQERVASRQ